MLTELNAPPKTISLKTGDEIIGLYKKLQKDGNKINLVLELADRSIVQTPFLKGSVEAEIMQKALCCVKHGVKIGIQKYNDSKSPICVKKFRNLRSKKWTIYVDVGDYERLNPFLEPGKKLSTAVTKLLDIIENKLTIVAILYKNSVHCNKMQDIGKKNRFYCSNLGATTCEEYCREKCVVANQIKKILGRNEVF